MTFQLSVIKQDENPINSVEDLVKSFFKRPFSSFNNLFFYNTSGIYAIINKKTKQTYIGETGLSLLARSYKNLNELRLNSHHNEKLQEDWNKLGEKNFKYVIIDQNISSEQKRKSEEKK